jgi:hypothetical protein
MNPAKRALWFIESHFAGAIRGTMNAIWNSWLPQSVYEAADAPGRAL